jgi:hypothetical protein
MTDITFMITLSACLAAFLIGVVALLRGWTGWLELKRAQLESRDMPHLPSAPSPAARIELADLKERVRRLEAIANGVEG